MNMAVVMLKPCRKCLSRLTSKSVPASFATINAGGRVGSLYFWDRHDRDPVNVTPASAATFSKSITTTSHILDRGVKKGYSSLYRSGAWCHHRHSSNSRPICSHKYNKRNCNLLLKNVNSLSHASETCRFHTTKSEPKINDNVQSGNQVFDVDGKPLVPKINSSLKNLYGISPSSSNQRRPEEREWIEPEGYDTGIYMYNSLTRRKEKLILPNGRIASWYTCGPTVYDQAHIGHASSYVRTDIIRRVMMNMFNIDIVMVMGVTDIDDKIIKRSKEMKMDFKRLARKYEQEFFRDMTMLKVLPPTVRTRVTEHIPAVIDFIQRIVDNKMAYRTPSGNVYFDVRSYGRYGRLWTHSLETEIRDAADKEKNSARDFALWKAAKPDEPYWESPFGRGRPGWHIECSTMASAIFGEKLDIHSGGVDLRFPHHENEMAQSEACFCSKQWTNYWLHTGYLHLKNDKFKMSKSLKNTIRVSELLEDYTPNQFRIFCMLRPYRQLVEFNEESMLKAVRIHSGWTSFLSMAEAYISGQLQCQPINEAYLMESLEETKLKVESSLSDDFDTPRAILAMEELVHRANKELGRKPLVQSVSGSRSPGVIAAVVAYVERIMELWGIKVSQRKTIEGNDSDVKFGNVMDSVVKFRRQVRNFGLQIPEAESLTVKTEAEVQDSKTSEIQTEKAKKKQRLKQMEPLLTACDELRDDLNSSGVKIQDHGAESTWNVMHPSGKSNK